MERFETSLQNHSILVDCGDVPYIGPANYVWRSKQERAVDKWYACTFAIVWFQKNQVQQNGFEPVFTYIQTEAKYGL